MTHCHSSQNESVRQVIDKPITESPAENDSVHGK
jgi:hypothetical protein